MKYSYIVQILVGKNMCRSLKEYLIKNIGLNVRLGKTKQNQM